MPSVPALYVITLYGALLLLWLQSVCTVCWDIVTSLNNEEEEKRIGFTDVVPSVPRARASKFVTLFK